MKNIMLDYAFCLISVVIVPKSQNKIAKYVENI